MMIPVPTLIMSPHYVAPTDLRCVPKKKKEKGYTALRSIRTDVKSKSGGKKIHKKTGNSSPSGLMVSICTHLSVLVLMCAPPPIYPTCFPATSTGCSALLYLSL